MAWMDVIPDLSQVKAVCQLIGGDADGANETARNFLTKTPVVAHTFGAIVGTVGIITDDREAKDLAVESFRGGTRTVSNALDAIPYVGHTKGAIHLLLGDRDGAARAFESSNKLFVALAKELDGVFGNTAQRPADYNTVIRALFTEDRALQRILNDTYSKDTETRTRTKREIEFKIFELQREFEETYGKARVETEAESNRNLTERQEQLIRELDETKAKCNRDIEKMRQMVNNEFEKHH